MNDLWPDCTLYMEAHEAEIRSFIESGESYQRISRHFKELYPSRRGFSARSVRRFCSDHGITRRNSLTDYQLDQIVSSCISAVGHSYGRKFMYGLLRSENVIVSERRIGESLGRTHPFQNHLRRQNMQKTVNPLPYRASFFGEKLHFDQNEKLSMYGVTHVLAVDGFSRKVVGFVTMPVKHPITIYDKLFHPILMQHGLWDQLRMDHGTEFVLVTTVQQFLAFHRDRVDHHPVVRSMSRNNHRAERLWVEVNRRVNYPVKEILVTMEGDEEIDMTDELTKFCVSWVTINVVSPAVKNFVVSWNSHRIPGRSGGIPNVLARISHCTTELQPSVVPTLAQAVSLHENRGGCLSAEGRYGSDPIASYPGLQQLRERDFREAYPSMNALFENILHEDGSLFKEAVHSFIDMTRRYGTLI